MKRVNVSDEKCKKVKRNRFKKVTKEAQVLRFMRKMRGLSYRKAAWIIGKSETFVAHIEHGRIDVSEKVVEEFVAAYGYGRDEFEMFMKSDDGLLVDYRELVIGMIYKMDDVQVLRVYSILKGMK